MIRDSNDLTSFKWATVKSVGPISIQLDGDTAPLLLIPDCLIDPSSLYVNDRVRVEMSLRKVVIHGKANGGSDSTQGWVKPTLSNGFTHHPTWPILYRANAGRFALRGACYRSSPTPANTYLTLFMIPNSRYFPTGQVRETGRADAGQSTAVTNNGEVQMLITAAVTGGVGLPVDGTNWDY